MYTYPLIRKYNCPKGTNWVTPGKALLAAAKAHKLRSLAKHSGIFGAQIKMWVHDNEYQMQQLSEIQAGRQCLKTAPECFILTESLLSHLSTVFQTKLDLSSCESQQQNTLFQKLHLCIQVSLVHMEVTFFSIQPNKIYDAISRLWKYCKHTTNTQFIVSCKGRLC